jgi:hypothetical protein
MAQRLHRLDGRELLAHGSFSLQLEQRFHLAHGGATTHQIRPAFAAEHELERRDQDALACTRFPCQHVQPGPELQLHRVDDCEIFDSQAAKHDGLLTITRPVSLFKSSVNKRSVCAGPRRSFFWARQGMPLACATAAVCCHRTCSQMAGLPGRGASMPLRCSVSPASCCMRCGSSPRPVPSRPTIIRAKHARTARCVSFNPSRDHARDAQRRRNYAFWATLAPHTVENAPGLLVNGRWGSDCPDHA